MCLRTEDSQDVLRKLSTGYTEKFLTTPELSPHAMPSPGRRASVIDCWAHRRATYTLSSYWTSSQRANDSQMSSVHVFSGSFLLSWTRLHLVQVKGRPQSRVSRLQPHAPASSAGFTMHFSKFQTRVFSGLKGSM